MSGTFCFTLLKYLTVLIITNCCTATEIEYSWLETSDKYDCIVGISVDGQPVSMGMIASEILIIASANPIERINEFNRVKIHTIDGAFDRQKERSIYRLTKNQGKRLSGGQWKTFGFDKRHAPQHDLVLISTEERIELNTGPRTPCNCSRLGNSTFDSSGRFSFVGFGFIDRPHVKLNMELEVVEYEYEDVYTECSEWIPLIWGNFICLLNLEYFVGVSSGSGLFYNGMLVGVGSFSVNRGKEGVLLFTDLRKYIQRLLYFFKRT